MSAGAKCLSRVLRALQLGLLCLACTMVRSGEVTLSATIPLPNVRGRIDHLAVDSSGRRLFVCALGNNSIEVVDLAEHKVMRSLEGFAEPQGVAYAAALNRLYVANGGDGTLRILNAAYFGELASIPLGTDADNVRFDTESRQVLVGYGEGGLAVIDVINNRLQAKIELPVHPEAFQLGQDGRTYVNLPDAGEVAVVDRNARQMIAHWRMRGAAANFPLALDDQGERVFVGCRTPAQLLILSAKDGRELGRSDLHGDCDDVFWDAKRSRVYATCGEGFIDVLQAEPGAKAKRVASVPTRPGARTGMIDGDQLYLAARQQGSAAAEIRVYDLPSP